MKKVSAVIMAGGNGTRLLPLTTNIPKPLLKVAGITSLEFNLNNVYRSVSEIVIVVSYLKEKIISFVGDSYQGVPVKYVFQKDPQGTGQALFLTKGTVSNSQILVLNGDDLYDKDLILSMLPYENAIAGKSEKNWQNFGVIKIKDGNFDQIVEKPTSFVSDFVNIGLYKFDEGIFDCFKKIKKSTRGEFELTDMVSTYAKESKVNIVKCNSGWRSLNYPWDLLDFCQGELSQIKTKILGTIEKGAVVKGKIFLGKNSIVKAGAYLEGNFYIGDNCEIGPNCYLKGFASISDGSNVGNAVEIVRSIIGHGSNIRHLSYVGDSIIGDNVNFGAGTVVANLRHDDANVFVMVKDKLVDSGRRKFGAIVGDGVETGAHTTLYPGTKLASGAFTIPGEVVKYEQKF